MKALKVIFAVGGLVWGCVFCGLIVLPNILVSEASIQMPFGGDQVRAWQMGVPQNSDAVPDAAIGSGSTAAGPSAVPHDGYQGPGGKPSGVPLDVKPKPWLNCLFHDPNYTSHTGNDFPVASGTPVHATMSGKVVFAGPNGPWGNLVVIENNDIQIWLAHNSSIDVSVGDIVSDRDVVSHSGSTGNSTGPHVHYGVKIFSGPGDKNGTWVDPHQFYSDSEVIKVPCQ